MFSPKKTDRVQLKKTPKQWRKRTWNKIHLSSGQVSAFCFPCPTFYSTCLLGKLERTERTSLVQKDVQKNLNSHLSHRQNNLSWTSRHQFFYNLKRDYFRPFCPVARTLYAAFKVFLNELLLYFARKWDLLLMFLDILTFVSLLLCSIFMIFEGQCERSFGTPVEQHHNNKRVKQVNTLPCL